MVIQKNTAEADVRFLKLLPAPNRFFYESINGQEEPGSRPRRLPYWIFGFVSSYSKGAEYGTGNRDPSAFIWKIRNSDCCIDRLASLFGFCPDFHGDHLGCGEGHHGCVDTWS